MQVTDQTFEKDVIEKSKEIPVIIDCWAEWCGPCLVLGPVIEKVVEEFKEKVILAKLNVDENPNKSREYDISAIPAVKIFKDGKVVDEFIGIIPEDSIRKWIQKNL